MFIPLMPCPFCYDKHDLARSRNAVRLEKSSRDFIDGKPCRVTFVTCKACGARGNKIKLNDIIPNNEARKIAIRSWNQRSISQSGLNRNPKIKICPFCYDSLTGKGSRATFAKSKGFVDGKSCEIAYVFCPDCHARTGKIQYTGTYDRNKAIAKWNQRSFDAFMTELPPEANESITNLTAE